MHNIRHKLCDMPNIKLDKRWDPRMVMSWIGFSPKCLVGSTDCVFEPVKNISDPIRSSPFRDRVPNLLTPLATIFYHCDFFILSRAGASQQTALIFTIIFLPPISRPFFNRTQIFNQFFPSTWNTYRRTGKIKILPNG